MQLPEEILSREPKDALLPRAHAEEALGIHNYKKTQNFQTPAALFFGSRAALLTVLRRCRLGDGGEGLGFEQRGCGNSHKLATLVLLLDKVELGRLRFDDERRDGGHQRLQVLFFVAVEKMREMEIETSPMGP